MRESINCIIISILFSTYSFSQEKEFIARDHIKKGNKAFATERYEQAIINYRKSLDNNPNNYKANLNLGNSYMKAMRFGEARKAYQQAIENSSNALEKAKAYHNIGVIEQSKEDWKKAVDAYKKAIILNPTDEETRYNLANAIKMLEEQEDNNEDQKDQNQERSEKEKQQQQQQEQEKKQEQQEEFTNEDEEEESSLDEEALEQLLNSLREEDEAIQQKMNEKDIQQKPNAEEKDW